MKRAIKYIVKNEVVFIDDFKDGFEPKIELIESMKEFISCQYNCDIDEVEVEMIENYNETSLIDVGVSGMHYYNLAYPDPIVGVRCSLKIGTDAYLDAMLDGSLEKHLHFFVEKT